ncbi:hypothetical protein [Marinobacterium lutimaris]|uniref:Uncharacterized protein n=1 Tax=Marinobacterium lutimaris TaxID=568106 RepID=A0A1H5XKR6_9GAMM|nr:hypothetical protein [Marinobacterium lutimaris]SEG11846.1 hypothetical protein SAMN05444390_1011408 [Marinobacterium lutimaris]
MGSLTQRIRDRQKAVTAGIAFDEIRRLAVTGQIHASALSNEDLIKSASTEELVFALDSIYRQFNGIVQEIEASGL